MTRIIQYQSGMSNAFFLIGDNGAIAVDSGTETGAAIVRQSLADAGLKPADIRLIVISHAHVDHFLNLPAMKEVIGAPVLCHKNGEEALVNGLFPDVEGRTTEGKAIMKKQKEEGDPVSHCPKVTPDIVIDTDTDLRPWGIEGTLVCTPGHSDSDLTVVLDGGAILAGDMITAPPTTGIPGLAFLARHGEAATPLIIRSAEKVLKNATIVYSGHGGPFRVEDIRAAVEAEKAAWKAKASQP